ncbi:MAG: M1 family aminopeptidase [Planctomycetota bacterium]|jgi:hypothetical protein
MMQTISGSGRVLAVLFALVTLTTAGQDSTGQGDLNIHTLKRTLIVKPDYQTGTLHATSVLTISNASAKLVKTIPAVLYHKLEVTAAHTPDGKALRFTQQVVPMAGAEKMLVRHVQIALDESLLPGATLSLEIKYQGKLAGYAETGRTYLKDHVSREFTIIRFDCLAYPLICNPSMAALMKSAMWDLSHGWDYLLEVTVPEQIVVANGGKLLRKTRANGEVTYSYRNIKPAWRIDVCIARYGILEKDGVPVKVFFLSKHKAEAQTVFAALVRSMEHYSKWFGPLSGLEGFTVIEVPRGYGSQTDVTCILQDAEAFKGKLHALYHEVSHLWNPPPLDPYPSRFQSEGLACFLEYLLEERLDNKAGSLQNGLALYYKNFRAQCRKNPKLKDVPIAQYGTQDCTEASYTKGAIAFWLLYRLVGEQTFTDIYRSFHKEYGSKGATLEDFITTVKKMSDKDLQKYFDEWIYGAKSSEHLLSDLSLQQILQLYVVEPVN